MNFDVLINPMNIFDEESFDVLIPCDRNMTCKKIKRKSFRFLTWTVHRYLADRRVQLPEDGVRDGRRPLAVVVDHVRLRALENVGL